MSIGFRRIFSQLFKTGREDTKNRAYLLKRGFLLERLETGVGWIHTNYTKRMNNLMSS